MKKQPRSSAQTSAPMASRKIVPVLSILFMFLFSSGVFSQEKVSLSGLQKDADAATWHTLKTIGSVTVSYQYVNCGPGEYVHFKISNTSSDKVSVSWTYKQFNNGTERNLIEDLAKVSYTVDANAAVKGGCGSDNFKLGVFIGEDGMTKRVTDIELSSITVTTAP